MLPKEQRDLIMLVGRYKFYKLKDLGIPLTVEAYKQYLEEEKKDKRIRQRLGYHRYNKMKKLNLSYKDFIEYEKNEKIKKSTRKDITENKRKEKDRIRFRTIRYIERYCNLEMKCQICNAQDKVQIHHPNYNDYLKINLLCHNHHKALHRFELIPPTIIDLEKIAIKKPIQKEKHEYLEKQIKNILEDIMENEYSYKQIVDKYKISQPMLKTRLSKEENWSQISSNLSKAGKRNLIESKVKNKKNPLQKYRLTNNLSVSELSKITNIPEPTIRAIECGKSQLSNIKNATKIKLQKIGVV